MPNQSKIAKAFRAYKKAGNKLPKGVTWNSKAAQDIYERQGFIPRDIQKMRAESYNLAKSLGFTPKKGQSWNSRTTTEEVEQFFQSQNIGQSVSQIRKFLEKRVSEPKTLNIAASLSIDDIIEALNNARKHSQNSYYIGYRSPNGGTVMYTLSSNFLRQLLQSVTNIEEENQGSDADFIRKAENDEYQLFILLRPAAPAMRTGAFFEKELLQMYDQIDLTQWQIFNSESCSYLPKSGANYHYESNHFAAISSIILYHISEGSLKKEHYHKFLEWRKANKYISEITLAICQSLSAAIGVKFGYNDRKAFINFSVTKKCERMRKIDDKYRFFTDCLGYSLLMAHIYGDISYEQYMLYRVWRSSVTAPFINNNRMKAVAEAIGCSIRVRIPDDTKVDSRSNISIAKVRGSETTIKIVLFRNHYMYDIPYDMHCGFALKNLSEVYGRENWGSLSKKVKDKYVVDKSNIRYFSIDRTIKTLEEQDAFIGVPFGKIMRQASLDKGVDLTNQKVIIRNDFFKFRNDHQEHEGFKAKENSIGELEFGKEPAHPFYNKKKEEIEDHSILFFDTETVTDIQHRAYLCSYIDYNSQEAHTFYGENCVEQMLEEWGATYTHKKIIAYAHNLGYDFSQIITVKNFKLSSIIRSSSSCIKAAKATYGDLQIHFKDSYTLIPLPLSKFGDAFGLETHKEVLPYDQYNSKTIHLETRPIEEMVSNLSDKDAAIFTENCEKWGLVPTSGVCKPLEYSAKYCEMDCIVLQQGFKRFRDCISEYGLDLVCYVSVPQIAYTYVLRSGGFEGVYKLGGFARAYIQQSVVGGRCMTARNEKQYVLINLEDCDAISLYSSSMCRDDFMIACGKPYSWSEVMAPKTVKEAAQFPMYFATIRVDSINRKLDFPILSVKSESGTRVFTNDVVGRRFILDKYTIEDLVQFQEAEITFIDGIFFKESNATEAFQKCVRRLFEDRLVYKKQGNTAMSVCTKLLMNALYGRTIQKPIEEHCQFFYDREEAQKYASKHHFTIKSITEIGGGVMIERNIATAHHESFPQVGSAILGMSKRIMNEVMTTAQENGVNIYYQDTDSMHVEQGAMEILEQKFKEKYGRALKGKNLGQFHDDFEASGVEVLHSKRFIAVGKKCYVDELHCMDKEGNECTRYHIRMKGIPSAVIRKYCDDNAITPTTLYEQLYNGQAVEFDLLSTGRPSFATSKAFDITTRTNFKRKLQFY